MALSTRRTVPLPPDKIIVKPRPEGPKVTLETVNWSHSQSWRDLDERRRRFDRIVTMDAVLTTLRVQSRLGETVPSAEKTRGRLLVTEIHL